MGDEQLALTLTANLLLMIDEADPLLRAIIDNFAADNASTAAAGSSGGGSSGGSSNSGASKHAAQLVSTSLDSFRIVLYSL
jgi:hypothetical protein